MLIQFLCVTFHATRSGEWGDHLTLQAAADRFGAKICLITSFRDTCFIEINPRDGNPTRGFMHLFLNPTPTCIPPLSLSLNFLARQSKAWP
ncbi:hypothetical protein CK203_094661 [Vitis vinifera]|uniref:OTU domain-containing protein n=1 Tax=Vitis vinifera TaxID=29760 RepID=A0A438CL46_VITVI|nr:hypothetical protein CK203_094661 [Vitis vinifera]